MSASHSVSQLLEQWNQGDREALDKLLPLIYEELRKMAKRYVGQQNPGHTLQTTALIHEACLRLVKQKDKHFENGAHFFGVAAQAMRHILVDYAKTKHRVRRGGVHNDLPLEEELTIKAHETDFDLLALDEALNRLAAKEAHLDKVVELRFFSAWTWWKRRKSWEVPSQPQTRLANGKGLAAP